MDRLEAERLLQQMLGADARFRDGQWEAIDRAANHRQRLLVVQRTGWGKSLVYFLATKILRDAGAGPTLLISPLLSLMRNQIAAAERAGIRALTIHSENLAEWPQVEDALRANRCDVLMVSPERLSNAGFLEKLLPLLAARIGLFVVDEAHCISDWGHDFRPDYRRIVRVLRHLPANVPVICTTATANNRVVQDVMSQVVSLELSRGPLIRPSLRLYNIRLADQAERLAWLAQFVPKLSGNGIIYTLTIQDARRVAEFLQREGIAARQYHADLEGEQRVQLEQALLRNEVKALVATVALGMGFDKPDLGFVIHFQRPGSVVAYYQQVGRAGRAVETAYGVLLSGREDDEIADYFIRTAFPPAEFMQQVLAVLEKATGMTIEEIGAALNCRRGTLEKALRLLEVDQAVEHRKTVWSRTANPWTPDVMRAEQVTALRRAEVEQMRRYVEHTGCLMEFLARALDDPSPASCGKCMNCTGQTHRQSPPTELVQRAVEFLRGDSILLSPRLRWPKTILPEVQRALPADAVVSSTVIPEPLRAQPGRALCIWGDAGWGREVADGKYVAGRFSDALLEAAARLVREKWNPQPAPAWVAAVPSWRRPELVRDFATRLAAKLGLPFAPLIQQLRDTQPQKQMENSVTQLRNLLGAFAVVGDLPRGPVLLVDDLTDSGWTMAVLSVLLQAHGSGPVHPFALAKSSPRNS
ncbi:MAG: RecQ family ATP-dependent DNA helicase [Verrucomicrobia bacterium]|nr:RecQ family ATP-dependent DNA helicase [Verrucomicrobiota bacterium]